MLLPTSESLLWPRYPVEEDAPAINKHKECQQYYYDQHVKPLKPLKVGEAVRVWLPGKKIWNPAVCSGMVGPRRYEDDAQYCIIMSTNHVIIMWQLLHYLHLLDIKWQAIYLGAGTLAQLSPLIFFLANSAIHSVWYTCTFPSQWHTCTCVYPPIYLPLKQWCCMKY